MLRRFHNSPRIQLVVLGIPGILLMIMAMSVQAKFWLGARHQRRVQAWRVSLPIDFSAFNTYQEDFRPIESHLDSPQLRMRGPLLSEFNETHLGGAHVPTHILRESFSKSAIDFNLSWKILEEGKVFDSGAFGPNDVNAWSYPDYVDYLATDYSGFRYLDTEKVYSLIVEVIKPCEALNKFKPTFILKPIWGKNMIFISNRFLRFTIPLFALGIVVLVYGIKKYRPVSKQN